MFIRGYMKTVCCWGCFDVLHKGHEEFLKDIKKLGDNLIVFIVPDIAIRELKNREPVNLQDKRAENIKKFPEVDRVIKHSDFDDFFEKLVKINPDIFAFGYDQNKIFQEKIREFCKNNELKTSFYVSKEFAGGIHTSKLLK